MALTLQMSRLGLEWVGSNCLRSTGESAAALGQEACLVQSLFRIGRKWKAVPSAVLCWGQLLDCLTVQPQPRAAPVSLIVLISKAEITWDSASLGSQGSVRGGAQ